MKKTLIALILMLTLVTTCFVGCATVVDPNAASTDLATKKANAAAIFTIDVNPGVRIYVDDDNTVITVEATNEDGESIVSELDVEEEDYETVVEEIIDKMEEEGYIEGDESSVLISVEKQDKDISDELNEKIEKTFEKHGKRASVIEQELDKLDDEMEKTIDDMSKKHHISKGKAHLIEKIREEFPELSEEDLAKLNVDELRMILEETSDHIKGQFKKIGKNIEKGCVGRDQALATAIESLEVTVEDVTMHRVRVTRGDDKMLYIVDLVYDGMEYKITVDAVTGEIIATESKEFVEFDAEGVIGDFCDKHNISPDELKDHIHDGEGDHHEDKNEGSEDKLLSKGDLLKGILAEFEIPKESLKETDVKMYETEIGTVYVVVVENISGDVYNFVVEAYTGMIIKAELNGTVMEIYVEETE